MYAVIQTGGKQYRVQPGDIVQIEKQDGEVGSALKFDQVLFLSKGNEEAAQITLGKPFVPSALVEGEIVGQGRGEKILIVKMKRRKQYRRTQGHRQNYTQILVTQIKNGAELVTLSESDKKEKLTKFQSHLTAKGPAATTPLLGSRKKRIAANKKAAS